MTPERAPADAARDEETAHKLIEVLPCELVLDLNETATQWNVHVGGRYILGSRDKRVSEVNAEQLRLGIAAALRAAREEGAREEREACAKVADTVAITLVRRGVRDDEITSMVRGPVVMVVEEVAAAIRSRKKSDK